MVHYLGIPVHAEGLFSDSPSLTKGGFSDSPSLTKGRFSDKPTLPAFVINFYRQGWFQHPGVAREWYSAQDSKNYRIQ